jgi:transcriptional regulator with XRE-family HTH domain
MAARRYQLVQRREAVGHTQESLAAAMNVDRTTVGRWESGRGAPQPWMRPKLAQALRVNADQLDALLTPAQPVIVESDHRALDRETDSGLVETVAAASADSALFIQFASGSNVDAVLLEQLDADLRRLATEYVSKPVPQLIHEISTLRRSVFELLRGRQRPQQAIQLYIAAGRLSGLATHVALDMGHYAVAATHARTAWLCAEQADDNALRAWVCSARSLIAYWQRDYLRAADVARAGIPYSDGSTIGARLLSLEARAAAALGDSRGAQLAVHAATHARTDPVPHELPGVFTFPEAKQWTYAGTTFLALEADRRHVRRAIDASTRAIALYQASAESDQSSGDLLAAHLDLASAHLADGDAEAAEQDLRPVLHVAPERLTASITRRLGALHQQLASPTYARSRAVVGLRENVEEACSRPALATTPEP